MSKFGLNNLDPLYEPHGFNGIDGILGSNCQECGYPFGAPWHQPKCDVKDALADAKEVK